MFVEVQVKTFLLYHIVILLIAFILDLILGDPNYPFHPVRLFGHLISFLEKSFRIKFRKDKYELAGLFMLVISIILVVAIYSILIYFSLLISKILYIFISAILLYQLLAIKSLMKESMKVYFALSENDIEKARYYLSMIVGRDTKILDEEGIIKASIETVAENFSDGVVAPILAYVFFGIYGVVVYKVVNTLDSMIGYKDEKYKDIGYFSAKLDDVLNFIPARVASFALLISAIFIKDLDIKNGIKIFLRDRYKHASPNSAQTESMVAGLLRIRLAGDAIYFGKLYKKDYIGDEFRKPKVEDIKLVNKLMLFASVLTVAFSVLCIFLLFIYM